MQGTSPPIAAAPPTASKLVVKTQAIDPGVDSFCPTGGATDNQLVYATCPDPNYPPGNTNCNYACAAPTGINQTQNGGGIATIIGCDCTGPSLGDSFNLEVELLCNVVSMSTDIISFCTKFAVAYVELMASFPD
jgi:hypothetical protein